MICEFIYLNLEIIKNFYIMQTSFKKPFYINVLLYIFGAIFQSSSIFILLKYKVEVSKLLNLPVVIEWFLGFSFITIIALIPALFFMGIKLFLKIKKVKIIFFKKEEIVKMKVVNFLLLTGIFVDLFFGIFLIFIFGNITDKSTILILCAIFTWKILQVNLMIIELYFHIKNPENKALMN